MPLRPVLLLSCVFVAACTSEASDPQPPFSDADARAVTEAAGSSLAETAAAIEELKQVVGPTEAGGAGPATLAEALTALKAARAALKADAPTVGQALADLEAALGGNGTLFERANAAIGAGNQCTSDLASLSAEANALTAVSGAGLAATTTSLSSLNSATGATTLADALVQLDAQRAALKDDASTLGDAVSAVSAALGGSGSVFNRASDLVSQETALLSASGADDLPALTSLITSLSTCMTLHSGTFATRAQNLICNDNGVASLQCYQGGGGFGARLVSTPTGDMPTAFGAVASDGMGGVTLEVAAGLGAASGIYFFPAVAAPIAANALFSMSSGANVLTFKNISGAAITNQQQLLRALRVYNYAMRVPNTCTNVERVEGGLGTSGGTPAARLAALTRQIDASSLSLNDALAATSSLVAAPTATNDNGVFFSVDAFQNATDLREQLGAFIQLFDPVAWNNSGDTQLTQSIGTPPTSLGDIVNRCTATSP